MKCLVSDWVTHGIPKSLAANLPGLPIVRWIDGQFIRLGCTAHDLEFLRRKPDFSEVVTTWLKSPKFRVTKEEMLRRIVVQDASNSRSIDDKPSKEELENYPEIFHPFLRRQENGRLGMPAIMAHRMSTVYEDFQFWEKRNRNMDGIVGADRNDRNVRNSHQDVIREAEGLHVLEMDREAAALLRTVPEGSEDYAEARAVLAATLLNSPDCAAAAAMGTASESLRAMAGEYRDFSSNFGSLQSYMEEGHFDQALLLLQRWLDRTKNAQVKIALTELLEALKKQKEERDARMAARMEEMLKTAATGAAAAETPEKLASIQIRLEEFRDFELNTSDRKSRLLHERLNRAINFLGNWQQVLLAEQSGDFSSALQSLGNLRRNTSSFQLLDSAVMASKYKALLEKLRTADATKKDSSPIFQAIGEIMAGVKSPADASKAASAVSELISFTSGNENRLASALHGNLQELARLNADFESGAYARVIGTWGSGYPETPYTQKIEAMREALRIRAVVVANDLPELGRPEKGENFTSYVRRLSVAAYEKKDWERLHTLLGVYFLLTGGRCTWTSDMKEGVGAYLSGKQLEDAGQFKEAAAQYIRCIAQLGPLVPRAEAAAAASSLQKNHPEAFSPAGRE